MMNLSLCFRKSPLLQLVGSLAALNLLAATASAQATNRVPTLEIQAGHVKAKVSPILYGLMTAGINHSYEGGLYGQLIRNCTFKANPARPVHWNAVGDATLSLDHNQPLTSALGVSLKVVLNRASKSAPAGIANGGFWGIPVRPNTTYHASFYARGKHFHGPLTISLVSDRDPKTVFARAEVSRISSKWRKYEVTLTTGDVPTSADNRLRITTTQSGTFWHRHGTLWFQVVSLFPPTYDHQPHGFRPDLMKLLKAMQPKFLRFPGGNYVEGPSIAKRFKWKKTIGPLEERPGHESPWGYWSTDGMGLLEYLEWCQDLHMQPVLVVYAGYSLNHQYVKPGPDLEPYVQSALEEIQYVTGSTNTTWGRRRALDGHSAPFYLHYVEIGNEDGFDRSGSYPGRFKQFYDAIKAKYPQLQVIATTPVTNCTPDLIDEHFYRSVEDMEAGAHMFDHRPRTGPKVFIGEWASYETSFPPWDRRSAHEPPTPDMLAALGDAAWMTGLERNSDLVIMQAYAPMFVNVNPGARQWRPDLIGYNALTSYGSPSYYAEVMFSRHHGNEILATHAQAIPKRTWSNGRRTDQLFFDATRSSRTGTIFLKVVNCLGVPQPVNIKISGASVAADGRAMVLKAKSPDATNSIRHPRNLVPVTETVDGLGGDFTRTFAPYSITVLELRTR